MVETPRAVIYTPAAPPSFSDQQIQGGIQWAYIEFQKLSRVMAGSQLTQFVPQSRVPTNPRVGLLFYSDGTHPPIASGEGLYVYKSTGWKFIG